MIINIPTKPRRVCYDPLYICSFRAVSKADFLGSPRSGVASREPRMLLLGNRSESHRCRNSIASSCFILSFEETLFLVTLYMIGLIDTALILCHCTPIHRLRLRKFPRRSHLVAALCPRRWTVRSLHAYTTVIKSVPNIRATYARLKMASSLYGAQ
jgi:hypothetical protein